MVTKNRYEGIDVLKCICAFLVVCIHAPFEIAGGAYFTAIARIAVPIFFMISGFLYQGVADKNRETIQIKKMLKYVLFSNLLYLGWKVIYSIIRYTAGQPVVIKEIFSAFSFNNICKMLFFNESPFGSHLWYLNAIVYVLVIVFILKKLKLFNILYWLTPILLLIDLIFGKYSIVLFGSEFSYIIVRNFLFVGIPYFMIGHAIYIYIYAKEASLFAESKILVAFNNIIYYSMHSGKSLISNL